MHAVARSAWRSDWPPLQRTAAVGMVLMQALAITMLMKPVFWWVLPIALAGWMAPRLRLMVPLPAAATFGPIILIGLLRHQFQKQEFIQMGFIGSEIAYEVAWGCLACQLATLFLSRFRERIPAWYLALSGTGMVFSGDIRITYEHVPRVMTIMMLYMVFWAAFAIGSRTCLPRDQSQTRFRTVMISMVLLGSVITGWFLASLYQRHASRLEYWVTEYLLRGRPTSAGDGFSGTGGLRDITRIKESMRDRVALVIDAPFHPDYLRGRVFTEFYRNHWEPSEPGEIVTPIATSSRLRTRYPEENVFLLTPEWPETPQRMTVWPVDLRSSIHFFLPQGTSVVACSSRILKRDPYGVIERDMRSSVSSYQALIDEQLTVPAENVDPVFLSLPNRLSPTIVQTAQEIFDGTTTTAEKIRAVEAFFHNNFTYDDGSQMSMRRARLSQFLAMRTPAHCEYFATATTILLRLANVPARYVTGFVVTGQNPLDGTYYARGKDAHAWVEAYDEELQSWVIVESTPYEGVPTPEPLPTQSMIQYSGKAMAVWGTELFRSGLLWDFLSKYGRTIGLTIALICLIALLIHLISQQYLIPFKKVSGIDKALLPLARERIRMDRFLSRYGVSRPPDESLLRFAKRLEQDSGFTTASSLADWYREYAALRFQGPIPNESAIENIREKRRQLTRLTRVPS